LSLEICKTPLRGCEPLVVLGDLLSEKLLGLLRYLLRITERVGKEEPQELVDHAACTLTATIGVGDGVEVRRDILLPFAIIGRFDVQTLLHVHDHVCPCLGRCSCEARDRKARHLLQLRATSSAWRT